MRRLNGPPAGAGEIDGYVVGAGEGVSPGDGDAGAVALGIVGVGFAPLVLVHISEYHEYDIFLEMLHKPMCPSKNETSLTKLSELIAI